jgi:hypothetical protein
VWIGMNPITVYLGESLVNYSRVAERLAGGSVRHWLDAAVTPGAGQALVSLLTLGIAVLFCRWLYRRQIFLRL